MTRIDFLHRIHSLRVRLMQKIRYVTYNYSLPKSLAGRLADYCEQTGRSPSDVVRQLMLEYLEGDRIPSGLSGASNKPIVRSSLRLRSTTLKAFENEVAAQGRPSKACVLEALLRAFLDRSPKIVERVSTSVLLPVTVMRTAVERATLRGLSLSDFLSEVIQSNLAPESAEKEI